jgi:lipopolysaccharide biosynthesis regulator YciM
MYDALLLILVFLFGALAFYLMYERYYRKTQQAEPSQYVEALQNLLDGKQESAFTKLRQVVVEETSNIDAYLRLGQILREHNRADRALQVHKDLTLRFGLSKSDKAAILQQLASDYLALNELSTAEAALKELVSVDPHNHWAHANRLKLLEKAGKWDEAYEAAEYVLKIEGNKSRKPLAKYKHQHGEQLYKAREYHKARVLYKEAIGLDPTFVPSYVAVGDAYHEEQRFEDAVSFWLRLVEVVPEQAHQVIERLKDTLFILGRFGDIVGICQNILEKYPKNNEVRRTLAEFYLKKGELDTAQEILVQILEEQPNDTAALTQLVRALLEQGNTRKLNELLRTLENRREKRKAADPVRIAGTASLRS